MQGKAPEPTSDKVRVVHVPGGRAYTREFSGFATGAPVNLRKLQGCMLEMPNRTLGLPDIDELHHWFC